MNQKFRICFKIVLKIMNCSTITVFHRELINTLAVNKIICIKIKTQLTSFGILFFVAVAQASWRAWLVHETVTRCGCSLRRIAPAPLWTPTFALPWSVPVIIRMCNKENDCVRITYAVGTKLQ